MSLNDTKEQIFISHEKLRTAWRKLRPGYKGKETKQAKDLRTCNRRISTSNGIIIERIKQAGPIAKRINRLRLTMAHKSIKAGAVILGGTLYGVETDHVNQKHMRRIRTMMCEAIWGNKGPKNQVATLLGIRNGVVEPYVRRAMQMVTNWNHLATEE